MSIFNPRHEPEDDDDNSLEGEPDLASVNKGLSRQNRITRLVGLVCVAGIGGWYIWDSTSTAMAQREQDKAPPKEVRKVANEVKPLPPLLPPEPAPAPPAVPAAPLPPLTPHPNGYAASGTAPTGVPTLSPREKLLQRRLESPLSLDQGVAPSAAAVATQVAGEVGAAGEAAATALPKVPAALRADASRPYVLQNPSMMLTRGMVIPCVVVPAIDTTLPGPVTCVQSSDVWSVDNKVLLLEKGTQWVGQQGSGISQGQRRVGIVWTRGITPRHVVVPMESPGTDMLGRLGIPGRVDHHFWDRFGAAILLSVISDIGPWLAASRSGGTNNTTIAFPNISGGAQEVVAEVLKTTLNIPPTLTAPQAAEVLIFVNQDRDFSDVYSLEAAK